MLEKDVVLPMKPSFYKRYVDDVISRRKKNTPDLLLEKMNKYHPKIKFTLEENPKMFLDTKLLISGGVCETRIYIGSQINFHYTGIQELQSVTSVMPSQGTYIELGKFQALIRTKSKLSVTNLLQLVFQNSLSHLSLIILTTLLRLMKVL